MLERNKFSVQARLLESAGKLDEAIAAAEQMLAIEREVLEATILTRLRHCVVWL